ncbi:hypothetical protein L207DRAFT_584468 [Hyaloscypha variabilis F]|uniref:Extracellular membrane protein CFEM domain-containing protein n=1 Tax=Hyaloscypha variabilis (strain UAMH 11265 / GT02V1 / F) TaxID=1149755 RepID=A0A2J6RKQ9_HYAVF|nr:hypothetical protein L207DRAFT_584468 [Hyaloscypha variabilis F]
MRRRNISILLAVPAANALSLANFQTITSDLIPLSCQLTYDSQIPSCTVSDFNNGCSEICVAGLDAVAKAVSDSCDDVRVSSSTLLGIVKNGGIVAALCPTLAKTSAQSIVPSVTVQPSTPAAQPAAVSVTIPTGGPGVTGGLGFITTSTSTSTSTTSSTPIPVPQSEISTTPTKSAKTAKTTKTTSTSQSGQAGGLGGSPATKSTTSAAKETTSTASSETTSSPQSQDKSGGGSPFDITSNDATRDAGRSMLALAVAVFAVVVIGR